MYHPQPVKTTPQNNAQIYEAQAKLLMAEGKGEICLAEAIRQGTDGLMIALIKRGAKLDGLLLIASQHNNLNAVIELLNKGARDKINDALRAAVGNDNTDIAAELLKHGADSNAMFREEDLTNPDSLATEYDRLGHAAAKQTRNSVLIESVKNKNSEMAKLLLEHGANVNAKNLNGATPLIKAVKNGDAKCLSLLINNRADSNARVNATAYIVQGHFASGNKSMNSKPAGDDLDVLGKSALDIAFDQKCPGIPEILIQAGAKIEVYHLSRALANNLMHLIPIFIQKGFKPQSSDLNLAIEAGNFEMAGMFIQHGAQPDPVDFKAKLIDAVLTNNVPKTRFLLRHGADSNAMVNLNGITVLMKAVRNGYKEIVELLIQFNADVNARAKATAHVMKQKVDVFVGYREVPKDPDSKCHRVGNYEPVYEKKEVDITLQDDKDILGNSVLEIARKFKHGEIIALLAPSPSAPPVSQHNSEAQLVTHAYTPATGSMRERPRNGLSKVLGSLKM